MNRRIVRFMRRAASDAPRRSVARLVPLICLLALCGCGREPGEEKQGKGSLKHYRLAAEQYRRGDFDTAIETYEKALELDPSLAEAHLDVGIIYDDYLRDKKKAAEHYREYLRLEPRSEKAEMVGRWIRRAEEEGEGVQPAADSAAAAASGAPVAHAAAQLELERAREDMSTLKAENEAYLKMIAALREELSQAKEKVADVLSRGAESAEEGGGSGETTESRGTLASLVRSLEGEKTQLWERYRNEKGELDRTVKLLRGDLAEAQARVKASDEALARANAQLAELKNASAGRKDSQLSAVSARQDLALANERIAELERANALYLKDNRALLAKLVSTEKELKAARASGRSETERDTPHVLAKAKADAERERQELKASYEKQITELKSAFERDKSALTRDLAEALARATPAAPHVLAKARADAEREKKDLAQSYEKQIVELKSALVRERSELQKAQAAAQREAQYLRAQIQKKEENAREAAQAHAFALQQLKEQQRKQRAELERRNMREREAGARQTEAPRPLAYAAASAAGAPSPAAQGSGSSRTAAKTVRRYKVVSGDSLRGLAARFYGSGERWKTIYDANRKVLSTPNSLAPGQILVIP